MEGDFAEGLDGIAVKRNVPFSSDLSALPDGMYGAGLIIGMHQADQNGIWPDRLSEIVGIQTAHPVHGQKSYLEALFG
jgi:hypothetical protein